MASPTATAARTAKFKDQPCPTCGSPRSVVDGAWLRTQRERAGLSLRETAQRIGYTAAYLCDIEYNRRGCSPKIRKFYERLS